MSDKSNKQAGERARLVELLNGLRKSVVGTSREVFTSADNKQATVEVSRFDTYGAKFEFHNDRPSGRGIRSEHMDISVRNVTSGNREAAIQFSIMKYTGYDSGRVRTDYCGFSIPADLAPFFLAIVNTEGADKALLAE